MKSDDEAKYIPDQTSAGLRRDPPNVLVKILAAVVGGAVLVGAFFVSIILLVIVMTAGLLFGAYIWWKTRELRKQFRERANKATRDGEVIDDVQFKETNKR